MPDFSLVKYVKIPISYLSVALACFEKEISFSEYFSDLEQFLNHFLEHFVFYLQWDIIKIASETEYTVELYALSIFELTSSLSTRNYFLLCLRICVKTLGKITCFIRVPNYWNINISFDMWYLILIIRINSHCMLFRYFFSFAMTNLKS